MRRLPPDATYSQALSDSSSVMPMPRLNSTGQLGLLADVLQQLEVLGVARADLEHHAGGVAGLPQRFVDLVDVGFVGHFHRDDADAVLARPARRRRAGRPRRGPGSRRDSCAACRRPRAWSGCRARCRARNISSTFSRVSTAHRPGKRWKVSWVMWTPLYSKPTASSPPSWRPIERYFSVIAHHPLDAGELLEGLGRDHPGRTQQVELGQRPGGALDLVKLGAHAGIGLCEVDQALDLGGSELTSALRTMITALHPLEWGVGRSPLPRSMCAHFVGVTFTNVPAHAFSGLRATYGGGAPFVNPGPLHCENSL